MDIIDKLNKELLKQNFMEHSSASHELDKYREVAYRYACLENAISVLSDMRTNISYIHYGGFSEVLGLKETEKVHLIHSIWEEGIFKLIHPDDLYQKNLQELKFFHFIKHQPKNKRKDFYLINKLRIKDAAGHYHSTLHRLFYIPVKNAPNTMWLALCLYTPLSLEMPGKSAVVYSVTGQLIELKNKDSTQILSEREKQVLRLIHQGWTSKQIAEILTISIHTVNRHRQEILGKLQVKNSIEACRIAKDLGVL